jgi:hypothetical protein
MSMGNTVQSTVRIGIDRIWESRNELNQPIERATMREREPQENKDNLHYPYSLFVLQESL